MKRPKTFVIASIILVVIGLWVLISIPVFLTSKSLGDNVFNARVKPAIAEGEAQLNTAGLPEPERSAVIKLNRWIVFERSFRIDYVVASAAFALALALMLAGLSIIMLGRIRAIERYIQKTQQEPDGNGLKPAP